MIEGASGAGQLAYSFSGTNYVLLDRSVSQSPPRVLAPDKAGIQSFDLLRVEDTIGPSRPSLFGTCIRIVVIWFVEGSVHHNRCGFLTFLYICSKRDRLTVCHPSWWVVFFLVCSEPKQQCIDLLVRRSLVAKWQKKASLFAWPRSAPGDYAIFKMFENLVCYMLIDVEFFFGGHFEVPCHDMKITNKNPFLLYCIRPARQTLCKSIAVQNEFFSVIGFKKSSICWIDQSAWGRGSTKTSYRASHIASLTQ